MATATETESDVQLVTELVSLSDFCREVDVSTRTVRILIEMHKVPTVRVGTACGLPDDSRTFLNNLLKATRKDFPVPRFGGYRPVLSRPRV